MSHSFSLGCTENTETGFSFECGTILFSVWFVGVGKSRENDDTCFSLFPKPPNPFLPSILCRWKLSSFQSLRRGETPITENFHKDPHIKTFSNSASPKFSYTFLNFSHPILKYSLITWIPHKRRPQFHRQVTCVGDIFLCFYMALDFILCYLWKMNTTT